MENSLPGDAKLPSETTPSLPRRMCERSWLKKPRLPYSSSSRSNSTGLNFPPVAPPSFLRAVGERSEYEGSLLKKEKKRGHDGGELQDDDGGAEPRRL